MRSILLAVLVLAACGPAESEKPKVSIPDKPAEKPKTPARTKTGVGVIQRDVSALAEDLTKIEKRVEKGADVEAWLRANQLKRWQNLMKACERAETAQAEQSFRHRYAMLRKELGDLNKSIQADRSEAAEIQQTVAAARAGVDEIPEGFTEAELRDRAAKLLEHARATEEVIKTHKTRMRPFEKAFAKGGPYKLDERTLFSTEVDALQKLKPRIDALQIR